MRRALLAALLAFGAVAGFASAAHELGGHGGWDRASWSHGAGSHGCPLQEGEAAPTPGS